MRNVLAVGAHPDDIELGCGATLLAHHAAGDAVTMLVMTNGQNGAGDAATVAGRRAEQEAAAALLGARLRWGGLVDCAVDADVTTIAIIEDAIAATAADIVYVHAPNDAHQDHRAIAAATLSAARRLPSVLHYQSPSTQAFTPSVFVDVTTHLAGKIAALRTHTSQLQLSATVDLDAVEATARYWGFQARLGAAEGFLPARYVLDLTPAADRNDPANPAVLPLRGRAQPAA